MKSVIAEVIKLASEPVALLWSDDLPAGALQFEPGKWGCAMSLIAVAAKGKTVALDRETFGCIGGGVGLGFGNQYDNFPGGLEGFSLFLSNGNAQTPQGPAIAAGMAAAGARQDFCDHFLHGERYRRDAALGRQYVEQLPIRDIPTRYVVFKSLTDLAEGELPISVTFFVNPDQLSACVVLANYDRADVDSVGIPHVAACQVVGLLSYAEAATGWPRCLVGLTDLSARQNLKTTLGSDKMSFTMPYQRFLQMEANVAGSFLENETWRSLIG
jgi:hypothetical protein